MTLSEFFKKKNAVKIGTPLKPMGKFPLIDAHDVIVEIVKDDEGKETEVRLDEKLKNVGNSNLVLDKTLTQEGMAADAKAVGDRIDEKLKDVGNSNLVLDKSLTQEGMAADAKAVGDVLGDIHSVLERI